MPPDAPSAAAPPSHFAVEAGPGEPSLFDADAKPVRPQPGVYARGAHAREAAAQQNARIAATARCGGAPPLLPPFLVRNGAGAVCVLPCDARRGARVAHAMYERRTQCQGRADKLQKPRSLRNCCAVGGEGRWPCGCCSPRRSDALPSARKAALQGLHSTPRAGAGGCWPRWRRRWGHGQRAAVPVQTAMRSRAARRGQKMLDTLMAELGVANGPEVPTRATCGAWLALRLEAIAMLELKKRLQARLAGDGAGPEGRGKRTHKAKARAFRTEWNEAPLLAPGWPAAKCWRERAHAQGHVASSWSAVDGVPLTQAGC